VSWRQEHIDALVAKVVLDPTRFDVIVGSDLFGDILSDLGRLQDVIDSRR
jgi:tartrate dehydrogenase/decarboxylase/D-malate dehydrogenase